MVVPVADEFETNKRKMSNWDATCIDTLAESYVHASSKKAAAAAAANKASLREQIYSELIRNRHFIPFAVETYSDLLMISVNLS